MTLAEYIRLTLGRRFTEAEKKAWKKLIREHRNDAEQSRVWTPEDIANAKREAKEIHKFFHPNGYDEQATSHQAGNET